MKNYNDQYYFHIKLQDYWRISEKNSNTLEPTKNNTQKRSIFQFINSSYAMYKNVVCSRYKQTHQEKSLSSVTVFFYIDSNWRQFREYTVAMFKFITYSTCKHYIM